MAQCKTVLVLAAHPDSGYEACDEDGEFVMFCRKDHGHEGDHETFPLNWPQKNNGLKLVESE